MSGLVIAVSVVLETDTRVELPKLTWSGQIQIQDCLDGQADLLPAGPAHYVQHAVEGGHGGGA